MNQQDLFYLFLNNLVQGNHSYALQLIFKSPNTPLDTLNSNEEAFPYVVNYADAVTHGTLVDAFYANNYLREKIESNPKCSSELESAISYLKNEAQKISSSIISRGTILPPNRISNSWKNLIASKPQLETIFPYSFIPWQEFQYPISNPLKITHAKKTTPAIFLEPTQQNFEPIVSLSENTHMIFVCNTIATFLQMLQFPELANVFSNNKHLIYILELYPNEQLVLQDWKKFQSSELIPQFCCPEAYEKAKITIFLASLSLCFQQPEEDVFLDTKIADLLYAQSKALLFDRENSKFGKSRHNALLERMSAMRWNDKHKSAYDLEQITHTISPNYFQEQISQCAKLRHPYKPGKSKKVKIAHIVPQIVDEGHAPSRLLETLINNHDKNKFEISIFSTERLVFRPMEYPFNTIVSLPSREVGKDRIALFEDQNIQVFIDDVRQNYLETAEGLRDMLNQLEIDIAVFHGPDCINQLAALMINASLRAFFEHGTLPSYPGFDLIIASTDDAQLLFQDKFKKLGSEVHSLPFSLDVRANWEVNPFPREGFGLPNEGFIMTTISNHLEARLSSEMLYAIAEILKRCPQAYYAPIGKISNPEKLGAHFQSHNLYKRVIFLGAKNNPSQYARSMNLYLNEFPFGSCLGMLDAMASGSPVVSMYDPTGPSQARYGGSFFGMDHVIKSGDVEGYINLACSLINDKAKYREWSEYTKKQYAKRTDVKAYVKTLEQLLLDHLN